MPTRNLHVEWSDRRRSAIHQAGCYIFARRRHCLRTVHSSWRGKNKRFFGLNKINTIKFRK